jgi:hypothetical protein
VKIWVDARSKEHGFDPEEIVFGIKELDVNQVSVCIREYRGRDDQHAAGPSFEPEDGLVKSLAVPNVTLYKRGSGDRFHPWLNLIQSDGFFQNLIYTCPTG